METYVLLCACIIISSLFGCIDGLLSQTGLERRDAAFSALCVVALSQIRIKPVSEFDMDAAVLALPIILFMLAAGRDRRASSMLTRLGAVCSAPLIIQGAVTLLDFLSRGYAFYTLRADLICPIQLALAALALIMTYYSNQTVKAQ